MKISACLITKNEEKNIRQCIESIKQVANEIILVDTGSTDKTIEIAREYNAKIYTYEWDDNFSNPRNYALDRATGDWIIFLDADEYFFNNTGKNIPGILTKVHSNKEIDGIMCRRLNVESSDGRIKSVDFMMRIFRNSKNLRYKGNIHENVKREDRNLKIVTVPEEQLQIYHNGYSSEIIESKLQRNLKLLLQNLNSSNYDKMTYFYLSDCYAVLGQYDKAIRYARMFIESGYRCIGLNTRPYINIISSMMRASYKKEEIISEIKKAIEKFPTHPEFYRYLGAIYILEKEYNNALEAYEDAVRYQNEYNGIEANNTPAYLYEIHYHMGLIYTYKNDYVKALGHFINALKEKKDHRESFDEMIKIIREESYEDIILLLKDIYDVNNKKDVEFLVARLSELKVGKPLLYYESIWRKKYGEEDSALMFALLSNGNYEGAFKYFFKCYLEDKGDWTALFSVVSALLSKNPENIKKIRKHISSSYARIIDAYCEDGSDTRFILGDFNCYIQMINEFILLADEEEVKRLIKLKNRFDEDISLYIGNTLMQHGIYTWAVEQYNDAIRCGNLDKAALYFNMAYCMYKQLDFENAAYFFEKAIKYGYINNDIFEYLSWIEEQCNNKGIKARVQNLIESKRQDEMQKNLESRNVYKDPVKAFKKAEELIKQGDYVEAKKLYGISVKYSGCEAISCFRLGEILNREGNIEEAQKYHIRAVESDPCLAAKITPKDHPSHEYKYRKVEETIVTKCPICGNEARPHSTYNCLTNMDYIDGFNPVRVWMYCENCSHIFANNYPSNINDVLKGDCDNYYDTPNTNLLPMLGSIMSNIKKYASGEKLLEIGLGAGEMTSVAKEFLFDVTGIEIRPANAEAISKMLNIPIFAVDFMEYEGDEPFDVVCMGDVIEHLKNPVEAIEKVNSLLKTKGVLWISTPNFESAFSYIMKDKDPMWRVCEHLNYFSYRSLKKVLDMCGFDVVDYKVSSHYNGSMEVIALKK